MVKVRISGSVRSFIEREARYLRERNVAAAENFLERLQEVRGNLSRFPEIGRTNILPVPGLRRLVLGDYVLDYDLREGSIEIVAMRHGRQQDPAPHTDDDFDYEGPE